MIVTPCVSEATSSRVTILFHYRQKDKISVIWAVKSHEKGSHTHMSHTMTDSEVVPFEQKLTKVMETFSQKFSSSMGGVKFSQYTDVHMKADFVMLEKSQQGIGPDNKTKSDKTTSGMKRFIFLLDVDVYQTAPAVNVDAFLGNGYKNTYTGGAKKGEPMVPVLDRCFNPLYEHFFSRMHGAQKHWAP